MHDAWEVAATAGKEHCANLLGALSLALADAMVCAVAEAGRRDLAAFTALLVIVARPGQSIGELAAALGISRSAAVRVVDRLQAHGQVLRGGGADGCSAGLQSTAAGQTTTGRMLAARRRSLTTTLDALSADQRSQFEAAVGSMLNTLPRSHADCPVGSAAP